jgi:uncharacterized membrane protein YqjE
LRKAQLWAAYAVAIALGLYSDLLMVCVLAAHALYVLAEHRSERDAFQRFAASAAGAVAMFAPWIAVCVANARQIGVEQSWAFNPYPMKLMLEKWAFNAASVLFDAEYADMRLVVAAGLMLALLAYAAVWNIRRNRKSAWFIATLGGTIAAEQILVDLATHGHESTTARYLIPLWISLLLSLAAFFAHAFEHRSRMVASGWFAAFAVVLVLAGISSKINSSAVVWWDNNDNYPSTSIAAEINASGASPLVVSEGHWAEVLVVSHYVAPQTQFFLFRNHPPAVIPLRHDAFLLAPSAATLRTMRENPRYSLVQVPIASLDSQALLNFHKNVRAAQRGLSGGVSWQNAFLFRLEPRVATNLYRGSV